jgi:acetylornithine deacetylase
MGMTGDAMSRLDETIALLGELIAFPTISTATNLAMIDHLAGLLEDAGARVEVFHDASEPLCHAWSRD